MHRLIFDRQFHLFVAVGIVNTVVGYGLFALFIFTGMHYTVASFLATVLGILFNFKSTGTIVFKSRDNRLLLRFFGVYGITYLLNIAFLAVFDYFNVSMYVAGALLLAPMAVVSFLMNRKFVFGDRS
jgi:putative flippase GtrA